MNPWNRQISVGFDDFQSAQQRACKFGDTFSTTGGTFDDRSFHCRNEKRLSLESQAACN